jgi:hypothetical protein
MDEAAPPMTLQTQKSGNVVVILTPSTEVKHLTVGSSEPHLLGR